MNLFLLFCVMLFTEKGHFQVKQLCMDVPLIRV